MPSRSAPTKLEIRMALGAQSREILISFIGRGLGLNVIGLVLGLLLAWASAQLMTTLLYGFQPDYAVAAALVSVVLVVVAAAACLVPARRASRIDPVNALQHE
jgi:putative ABC transport system permease protein